MVCITASLIAGGLGAASSIGGSLIQSSAAGSAASQQATSAANALATQQQMFSTAQNALSPYYTAGQSALPTLQSLLTPGTSANALQQMPGFKFQSQYGDLAATNQLAAQGLGGSGGPLGYALSNYNQGLAGTYYTNTTNALQQYANMGTSAAGALAGDAINSGNSQAQTQQAQGSDIASGTLGSANALAGGLTGASGSVNNALLMSTMMSMNPANSVYGGMSAATMDPW